MLETCSSGGMVNRESQVDRSVTFSLRAPETLNYASAATRGHFRATLRLKAETTLNNIDVAIRVVSANGPLTNPNVLSISSLGNQPLEVEFPAFSFDTNAIFNVSDPETGLIEAEILAGSEQVASAKWQIQVLPGNMWVAFQDDYEASLELLAAFSQPNHPSVGDILRQTSEILESKGLGSGLTGHQDPSRIVPMVEAIYESIQARSLRYSNPPASWSGPGQKVRTAQEILEQNFGTCLDTTMLMSSCLEQAGLHPILVLVPGHAFVGYWSEEFVRKHGENASINFRVLAVDDAKSLIDLEFVRFIETVDLTSDVSFEVSQSRGRLKLDTVGAFGSEIARSHLINVVGCRTTYPKIDPLPARNVKADGSVEIIEYKPPIVDMESLRKRYAERDAVSGQKVSLDVPPIVRQWLDSLLDLSLRNPLINFANKRSATRLLIPTGSLGDVEDRLQNEKEFTLHPNPYSRLNKHSGEREVAELNNFRGEVPADPEIVNYLNSGITDPKGRLHTEIGDFETFINKMRKTASEAKSMQQDTGSNALYLALGSLTWSFGSSEIESPLVLIPVNLTGKDRGKVFTLSLEESGVTPNFSLVEKLKIEHKINLSGLAELATDKFGIDIDGTLKYVREELVKGGLKDFKVNSTATLGFFNFSSYRLWKDLLDNWHRFESNPLVKHLIHTPGEAFEDPVNDDGEEDLDQLISQLPISADGSQAKAIAMAVQGKTFVLQGPPGTGKSQTITNLLARALDQGKRVLFVAEKRDALDVVKDRIDACGLGAFSLDLHDKNSTTKAVKQQLADVIDIHIEADKQGFDAAVQDYQAALGPLRSYRAQLHTDGDLSESLYSAMTKYLNLSTNFELTIPGAFIPKASVELVGRLEEEAKSLASLGATAGTAQSNPWSFLDVASKLGPEELKTLGEVAIELSNQLSSLEKNPNFVRFLDNISDIESLGMLEAVASASLDESTLSYLKSQSSIGELGELSKAISKLSEKVFAETLDLKRLPKVDLSRYETEHRLALSSNFIAKPFKLSKLLKTFAAELGVQSKHKKSDFAQLLERLGNIQELGSQVQRRLEAIPGLNLDAVSVFTQDGITELSSLVTRLSNTAGIFALDGLATEVAEALLTHTSEGEKTATKVIPGLVAKLFDLATVSEDSITRWAGELTFGQRLLASHKSWHRDVLEFGSTPLIRWNDMLMSSQLFRENNLSAAREEILSGKVPLEHAANAFKKGYFHALFENLLVVQGLSNFDGAQINNYIRKLEDSHNRLRERLPRLLGSELLGRRGFDGSMKVGAIGDLVLSVKQARSNLSLRALLEKHWAVISQMTPCVLASPDSAVRFLSPKFDQFDLVVFDEASQIRVANSIGALGRAKAAVIVGDSEQMPPTSVAVARTVVSDDEPDTEEEDFGIPESILDQCGIARVPEVMLSWHYRSEDESLIAFSNHRFYKGSLSTFPMPRTKNTERRLSLVPVAGQLIRSSSDDSGMAKGQGKLLRTNPDEAKAIVKDIERRLADSKLQKESIGIVTLNKQQKDLIESMLRNSSNNLVQKALEEGIGGEELLIKALENVQGSERDVILLSIAFSPKRSNPDVLPLQFGPIIYQGGHRRLNVAITRARKEVKVFSSFPARMLEERKPASRGLQELALFLRVAESQDVSSFDAFTSKEERIDVHRAKVASELRNAGLEVVEELGLSDFKVDIAVMDKRKPEKAVLGILLDGQRWNKRSTVSDRDALPVAMLTQRMGWPHVERIWMPNWLRDQKGEVARIVASYENYKDSKPEVAARKEVKTVDPIYVQKSDLNGTSFAATRNPIDALLEETNAWVELQPDHLGPQEYLDNLHNSKIRELIAEIGKQLTETEGPVSPARFAKFVGNCFGFNRMVSARAASINSVPLKGMARDKEGFLFPAGHKPESYDAWKKSEPGEGRCAADISLKEMSNAMKAIATAAHGVRPEQLLKEASRVFGIQKLSKDASSRFELALAEALKSGQITNNGDYLI